MTKLFINSSNNKLKLNSALNSNIIIKGGAKISNILFLRPYLKDILYMSYDDGDTWINITYLIDNNLSSYQARYLYVNPSNTNHIVADFRESSSSSSLQHILWSNDKGLTWQHHTRSGYSGNIWISDDGQRITNYQWGSPYQMSVSSDGGANWTNNGINAPRGTATPDGKYLLASLDLNIVKESSNYGVTWGNTAASSMRSGIWSSDDGKYAIQSQYSGQTVQTSQDYGLTWTTQTTPGGSSSTGSDMDRSGKYMIYLNYSTGARAIYVSHDYGVTFFNPAVDGNTIHNLNRFNPEFCMPNGACAGFSVTSGYQTKLWVSLDFGATYNEVSDFSSEADVVSIAQVHLPRSGSHVSVLCTTSSGRALFTTKLNNWANWKRVKDIPSSAGAYLCNYF